MRRPKYSSNSAIFAKRGDPWVSQRQGVEDFGRVLATEDADFDAMLRAQLAPEKPKYVDPKPPGKPKNDYARRKTNIILNMRNAIREAEKNTDIIEESRRNFKPCAGCRKAMCVAKGVCLLF